MIYAFIWEMGRKTNTFYYLKLVVHRCRILKCNKTIIMHLRHSLLNPGASRALRFPKQNRPNELNGSVLNCRSDLLFWC